MNSEGGARSLRLFLRPAFIDVLVGAVLLFLLLSCLCGTGGLGSEDARIAALHLPHLLLLVLEIPLLWWPLGSVQGFVPYVPALFIVFSLLLAFPADAWAAVCRLGILIATPNLCNGLYAGLSFLFLLTAVGYAVIAASSLRYFSFGGGPSSAAAAAAGFGEFGGGGNGRKDALAHFRRLTGSKIA